MKLKIQEVIENVRDELLCYEDAEQTAARWEKEFQEWVEKNKGKKKLQAMGTGPENLAENRHFSRYNRGIGTAYRRYRGIQLFQRNS